MTRALGDSVMTRANVIPTPEISHVHIRGEMGGRPASCILLVASDGIFDVMSNDEAIDLAHKTLSSSSSLTEACSVLVQEARRKWRGGLPMEVRIDDTTVAAMSFRLKN
eukprot:CAMPEP_0197244296 /NCGR_PEP_ID=MMETSP1429-20130617/9466_1 /TAXON_ID=49237 /ORGANISM="Chaetoceros  sp., Strain UNC1202" /LENGTH=108 /DNA_ID=CAMNT_0042704641 /DNA_START=111 /DNA_END=437 /DNA_ORIENTATION=+